jgi:hypothetical protein
MLRTTSDLATGHVGITSERIPWLVVHLMAVTANTAMVE